jgi:HAD superfamily hydrolase (TIGR01509 family)
MPPPAVCYGRPVQTPGALLFDMDGTMVDSEPAWFELQRDFVAARGGEWTAAHGLMCAGGGLVNALRVMERTFGFAIDLERDFAWMVEAFVSRIDRLVAKPGLFEILEAAGKRGVPCAVASSSTQRLVGATLERFALGERFAAVVTGECVAHPKPAPDIFLEAASRLGVAPGACVVLEDAIAGVRAARAAEMRVVAVPEPEHRDRAAFVELADVVVGDLHEARAVLGF